MPLPPVKQESWDTYQQAEGERATADAMASIDAARQAQDQAQAASDAADARQQAEHEQRSQAMLQAALAPAYQAQQAAQESERAASVREQSQAQLDAALAPARDAWARANAPRQPGLTATPSTRDQYGTEQQGGAGLSRVYQDARAAGLDDEGARVAVAVARTEGGMGGSVGDQGQSAGTFQFFHGGGMGDAYARDQGISPAESIARLRADPHAGNAYALSGYLGQAIREGQAKGLRGADLATYAQQHGQRSVSPERAGASYTALESQSFDGTAADAASGPPATPGAESTQNARARTPSRAEAVGQFEQGLPYEEAASICGPVAALALIQANGRNPSLGEVRAMAKQVGWTAAGGMNGVANEQRLLERMGVASRLDTNPDFGQVAQDAASGNPVIISTGVHYYYANGYDPQTGKLHVGKTGEARRGGGSWMTAQQIADLDGGVNGVLYVDNPQSPQPSVAASSDVGQEQDLPASMRGVFQPQQPVSPVDQPDEQTLPPEMRGVFTPPPDTVGAGIRKGIVGQPEAVVTDERGADQQDQAPGAPGIGSNTLLNLGPAGLRSPLSPPIHRPDLGPPDEETARRLAEGKFGVEDVIGGGAAKAVGVVTEPLAWDTPGRAVASIAKIVTALATDQGMLGSFFGRQQATQPGAVGDIVTGEEALARNVRRQEGIGGTGGGVGGLVRAAGEVAGDAGALARRAEEAPVPPAPTFFSQLRRTIAEKMPNRASAEQVQGILRGSPVKPDEIRWTGFDDFLAERAGQPIAKQEALDFLDANAVRVEEVVKGPPGVFRGDPAAARATFVDRLEGQGMPLHLANDFADKVADGRVDPDSFAGAAAEAAHALARAEDAQRLGGLPRRDTRKYAQYQLPGGEDYRELLITLPEKGPQPRASEELTTAANAEMARAGLPPTATRYQLVQAVGADAADRLDRMRMGIDPDPPAGVATPYHSGHFDEPNILAHVRFNDRTDAEGKRVLFVEELQSDWAQQGREKGFQERGQKPFAVFDADDRPVAFFDTQNAARDALRTTTGGVTYGRIPGEMIQGVPASPFATTDKWATLAFKRVLRYGAENGYDRVAWTPGTVQVDRYSNQLRQSVDSLRWDARTGRLEGVKGGARVFDEVVPAEALEGTVGRSVAQQLQATGQAAGRDLTVGGEGMKGFYDQILPGVADKLGKKFGARVGTTQISESSPEMVRQATAAGADPRAYARTTVHSLDITPAMRASVVGEGQALFAAPQATGAVTGGAAGYASEPDQQPGESDADYQRRLALATGRGALAGGVLGAAATPGGRRVLRDLGERARRAGVMPGLSVTPTGGPTPSSGASAAERAAMPAVDKLLTQWDAGTRPGGPGPLQRLEEARTFLVRKLTDRRVDLNQLQHEVTRLMGGTLPEDMQVSELSRMNPTGAATLRVQNEIAPAIRAAGDDLPYVNALLAARGNVDVAAVKGQGRAFSGGVTAAESADVPNQLRLTLGPDRFTVVDDAANRIVQVNRDLRQMLVDSGRITQETADDWAKTYPNYTPVDVIDYLTEQSGLPRSGQGKSLGVQGPALQRLSEAGTERARLSPIASTINNVFDVHALAMQQATFNAVHNWVDRVPEMANRFVVETGGYTGTNAERVVTGYRNGERVAVGTPFPEMARVLRQDPQQAIPVIGPMMQVFKELITARNPAFLVKNTFYDFPAYLIRETARAGGMPTATARALGRYAAAVPDAFGGLLSGEFTGPATQRYLGQGGSMEAWAQRVRSPADAERYVQELRRTGGIHLSNPADVLAASKALLTGQTFKTIGERIELVPRVAAFRAGEQAGLSPARAVVRGRDVTVDFAEGGTWAKFLNQAIPFLNPAMQGGAGLARTVYENKRGAGMTFALGLVAPTLAVEAWNNADEERQRAYADVPNYVKDRGWVVMLPGVGGRGVLTYTDERGNQRPQYVAMNFRQYAPIVAATRAAGDAAFGRNARSWADLLQGAAQQVAPTADFGSATPLGVRTGAELWMNKDFYRGSAIATESADERASLLSKAFADGLNAVAGIDYPGIGAHYPNVRPSQVEFAAKENLGVLAQVAAGASDVVTGRKARSSVPEDIPVLGGFLRGPLGSATGQQGEDARDAMLSGPMKQALHRAGVNPDVAPAPGDIDGAPLRQTERTAYQRTTNRLVAEAVRDAMLDPDWLRGRPEQRKDLLSDAVRRARAEAKNEMRDRIGDAVLELRRPVGAGR